jgi:L-lactate dehydrogenase (cytochrome)/(S)-mandelate dehydrogenase
MNVSHSIADLEERARRYLPRVLYDWIAGGAEDEIGLRASTRVYSEHRLVPRYGRAVTTPSLATPLFGRTYGRPFGIAPTGYTSLCRPGGESMLRAAAARVDIPYLLSGVSVPSLEAIAAEEPGRSWFQVYPARDHAITLDIVRRARDAGYATLVVTMDMPKEAKRERDWRNGFSLPLRFNLKRLLDGVTHPAWALRFLATGGLPTLGTWQAYLPEGASPMEVLRFHTQQGYPVVTWEHLADFRALWPGQIVVKGLLHPDDVTTALDAGADGIILSNHGGRQLDRAPTTLEMLPRVRKIVGPTVPIMLDGGIRRGSDIAIALALGADFVFCGRAILWGIIADGRAGADQAIDILTDELVRVMCQTGTANVREFNQDSLL